MRDPCQVRGGLRSQLSVLEAIGLAALAFTWLAGGAWAAGGDVCATATAINTLPFTDTGDLCQFANNYDEACSNAASGRDAVYTFIAQADDCLNLSTCNTTAPLDLELYVYSSNAGGCAQPGAGNTPLDVACNDNGCGTHARILGLQVEAGVQYWVVVDSNGTACNEYRLDVVRCPSGQCISNAPCDDGRFCNGVESCGSDNRCHPGIEPPCSDGNPCTADACGPAEDACVHPRISGCCQRDQDCQDGGVCNGIEICVNGSCQSSEPISCDDAEPCTQDICDEDVGICEHAVIPGCCHTDAQCVDNNPCTMDLCQQNRCNHPPLPPATPCGDPRLTQCSQPDACDGESFCRPRHLPNGTICDDEDECTRSETCSAGRCLGISDPSCEGCDAGPPDDPLQSLSFQALLTNAAGFPINGPVELLFYVYDAVGNLLLSTGPRNSVFALDGIVNALIPVDATVFGAGLARSIGVSVNGGAELAPRIPLSSSPQAFRVDCVGPQDLPQSLNLGDGSRSGMLRLFGPAGNTAALESTINLDGAAGAINVQNTIGAAGTDDGPPGVEMGKQGTFGSCGGGPALCICGSSVFRDAECDTVVEIRTCESNGGLPYGSGGEILLSRNCGFQTIELDADSTGGTAELAMWEPDGIVKTFELVATETGSDGSQITMRNAEGTTTVQIDAEGSAGAAIRLYQDDYDPDSSTRDDDIGVALDGNYDSGSGGYGRIRVRNASGETRIYIDGDYVGSGKGRIRTDTLRIEGGSDLSESFHVEPGSGEVLPGMVVSIDPKRPGRLVVSAVAYDRRVAGIISGAGEVSTGLLMGQTGSVADGDHPVALTGRVYCWADASHGPIEAGDLLTTSDIPGHAMKVGDHAKASAAIIGKAMTPLSEGRGLVLVLVSLQ